VRPGLRGYGDDSRLVVAAVSDANESFADFLALLYHEARNVRHLIRAGRASASAYAPLTTGLPTNRYEAWRTIQDARSNARQAGTAVACAEIFEQSFRLSLRDLIILFENDGWKHSARGGNQWATIATAVTELYHALEGGDADRTNRLVSAITEIRHNTGIVRDKLLDLDMSLRS
jgi:hypothetical protein